MKKLTPGSEGVQLRHCSCPTEENTGGRGTIFPSDGEPIFTFDPLCKFHKGSWEPVKGWPDNMGRMIA